MCFCFKFIQLLVLLCPAVLLQGQQLNKNHIGRVHTEVMYLMNDYTKVLNTIARYSGNNEAKVNLGKTQFIGLFLNRKIALYNDLDPKHTLSEYYEVETYISNLTLWYPDGMNIVINSDKLEISNVYFHSGNIRFVDVKATKIINGNYRNKAINTNSEDLTFRIAFTQSGNHFNNFKFVGIRNVKANTNDVSTEHLNELNTPEYLAGLKNVKDAVQSVLLDYERALQLIGDPEISTDDKTLFINDVLSRFESPNTMVINDINPKPQKEYISIQQYLNNIMVHYPQGIRNISLTTDSLHFGNIEELEDGTYRITAYATKFFSGNFQGKESYVASWKEVFTIGFIKEGGRYTRYKISNIDRFLIDLSKIKEGKGALNMFNNIHPMTRKCNNTIEISYVIGKSIVLNQNSSALTIADDYHERQNIGRKGFGVNVTYNNYLNNSFAFTTGLNFTRYRSLDRLNGIFQYNGVTYYDKNGDPYFPRAGDEQSPIAMDSLCTLNYLSIPLTVTFVSDINRTLSLYANAGAMFSMSLSTSASLTGTYYYYGYYTDPDHKYVEILHEQELVGRFGIEENISRETNPPEVNRLGITGVVSVGIMLNIGYLSSIKMGVRLQQSLTSIQSDLTYIDIFTGVHEFKPVNLQFAGIEMAYVYKLF